MKKIKLILLSVFFLALVTLAVNLVMMFIDWLKMPSAEELDQGAIKKLEEAYDDKFMLIKKEHGTYGGVFGRGARKDLYLKSEKYPDKEIILRYEYNKPKKEYEILSNYNFCRYEEKMKEKMQGLNSVFPINKFDIHLDNKIERLSTCSFEEYISSVNRATLTIFLSPDSSEANKEADMERLRQFLKSNNMRFCYVKVFYITDYSAYDTINVNNRDSYEQVELYKYLKGVFYMNENFEWDSSSKWDNE